MVIMDRNKSLRFPSFWQMQVMGWLGFYVMGLVGSIPELLRRPEALYHHTVAVAFMFLGSCALRPVCRSLLRRSRSWLSFELQAAVWSVVL